MTSHKTFSELPQVITEVLTERFKHIYELFVPDPDESVVPSRNIECLALSTAFRSNLLHLVESLHSDVRLRLSACARVNQLPDDILIHILSMMSLKELVNATHVCHRWRKLGIETPALWTRLDLTGGFVAHADELFARSKSMALDIKIGLSSAYVPRMRALSVLVTSNIGRARSLSISSSGLKSFQYLVKQSTPSDQKLDPFLAPILTTLRIDADLSLFGEYFIDASGDRLSFDCSALQEAYIWRGLSDMELLRPCTQLRVLVLQLAHMISGTDVLRLLRDNPALCDVELHVPPGWNQYQSLLHLPVSPADAVMDGAPLVSSIRRFAVLAGPADRRDGLPRIMNDSYTNLLLAATMFFVNRVDFSEIPSVEVACSLETLDEPLGNALLGHLQGVTTVKLSDDALQLRDPRGYTRHFSRLSGVQGPLDLALPFLEHVRVLDLSLEEWQRLNKWHAITELAYLEDLSLTALLQNFSTMERGVACPGLRSLTLTLLHFFAPRTKNEVLSVGKDVALQRLESCPPLRSLTIIREVEHEHLEDETLHFAAPLPLTVFLTSAAPADVLPALMKDPDTDSESDSAWDSDSDSDSEGDSENSM